MSGYVTDYGSLEDGSSGFATSTVTYVRHDAKSEYE